MKGRRANRATGAGYWKATGKEKPVAVSVAAAPRSQAAAVVVGMKRSLVFYRGKPPTGKKTDWVMHEYRLAGAGLARAAAPTADHPARPPRAGCSAACSGRKAPRPRRQPAHRRRRRRRRHHGARRRRRGGVRFIDFFARADARRPQRRRCRRAA